MPLPPYNSEPYRRLLALCNDRITLSDSEMSRRQKAWTEADDAFQAYIDLPASAQVRKRKARDKAEYPGTAPFIVPKIAAMTVTMVSHMHGVFTRRSPVFECEGLNPQSVKSAKAMELMLDYHFAMTGGAVRLWEMLFGHFKYGFDAAAVLWEDRSRIMSVPTEMQILDPLTGQPTSSRIENVRAPVRYYQGNRIRHIDPWQCYPDPRVPISNFQEGEFFAWSERWTTTELLAKMRDGFYENVDFIVEATKRFKSKAQFGGALLKAFPRSNGRNVSKNARWRDELDPYNPTLYEITINIIPKDYGLSDSEDIEKWQVTMANGVALLRADPLEYPHGQFPVVCSEYLPDGNSFLGGKSYVEFMEPLQAHVSWLVNSHVENIRKALNDVIIYNPAGINSNDIESTTPGKRIRIQPAGQGQDVRALIQQLQVHDVTAQHISEAAGVGDWMDRLGFAPATLQGQVTKGRTTAREITAMSAGATGILQTLAVLFSEQAMIPMADQMIANIQGRSEIEQWVRVVGPAALARLAEVGLQPDGTLLNVKPEDIQGQIYYVPTDGTYPLDAQYRAQQFMQFMQVVGSNPQLMALYDMLEVSRKFFEYLGIKNIDAFRNTAPQVQVQDPGQIAEQARQGNLAPASNPDAQREAGLQGQGSPDGSVGAMLAQLAQQGGDISGLATGMAPRVG